MKVWHYRITSEGGEGWAHIMIREDGFFATVSDYGNYSYWWTSSGHKDVRRFFLRAERDWDYFATKFKPERHVDDEASFKNVIHDITLERRRQELTREQARERMEHVKYYAGHDDWEGFVRDDQTFTYWESPWEFSSTRLDADVAAFAKRVLPKLVRLIEAELRQETLDKAARRWQVACAVVTTVVLGPFYWTLNHVGWSAVAFSPYIVYFIVPLLAAGLTWLFTVRALHQASPVRAASRTGP